MGGSAQASHYSEWLELSRPDIPPGKSGPMEEACRFLCRVLRTCARLPSGGLHLCPSWGLAHCVQRKGCLKHCTHSHTCGLRRAVCVKGHTDWPRELTTRTCTPTLPKVQLPGGETLTIEGSGGSSQGPAGRTIDVDFTEVR